MLSILSVLLSIEIFAGCAKYFRNAEGAENAEGESAFSHPSNLSALSAPSAFLSLVAACRAMPLRLGVSLLAPETAGTAGWPWCRPGAFATIARAMDLEELQKI